MYSLLYQSMRLIKPISKSKEHFKLANVTIANKALSKPLLKLNKTTCKKTERSPEFRKIYSAAVGENVIFNDTSACNTSNPITVNKFQLSEVVSLFKRSARFFCLPESDNQHAAKVYIINHTPTSPIMFSWTT